MSREPLDYDHLIVGAGVSGLTLADHLAETLGPEARILVVDKDDDPDYHISFWLEGEPPFGPVMKRAWRKIRVRHGARSTVCELDRYRLHCFWRDDFDEHLLSRLAERPNVTLREAEVREVIEREGHARVETSQGALRAAWVYDSRASLARIRKDDPSLMWMQGLAVEVESDRAVFEPETATLFDFLLDSPQFDFMYVLPYDEHHALVNAAFVTPFATRIEREHCEAVIDRYLRERMGVTGYRVEKSCFGRLPLADRFPEREPGSRVLPIGLRAGMIKSSTSYAFTRILADARRMARALAETGQPYYRERSAWYYRAADRYTSEVFHRAPALAQELMFGMFTPERGDLALAFLDERNDLSENRALFEAVEPETLKRFLGELVAAALGRDDDGA